MKAAEQHLTTKKPAGLGMHQLPRTAAKAGRHDGGQYNVDTFMTHLFQALVKVVQLAQCQSEAAADSVQVSAAWYRNRNQQCTLHPHALSVGSCIIKNNKRKVIFQRLDVYIEQKVASLWVCA